MESEGQCDGETDGAYFHRIEQEHRIGHYFLILPPGCKVLGTVFEGGMLERDFHWGRDPAIVLFLHRSIAQVDGGRITFVEQGKRTRYLESVASRAHDVVFWETVEELERHALKRSRLIWFQG